MGEELVDQGVRCLLPFGPPAEGRRVVLRHTGAGTRRACQRASRRRIAQALAVCGDAGVNSSAEALPQGNRSANRHWDLHTAVIARAIQPPPGSTTAGTQVSRKSLLTDVANLTARNGR
ncbi:hypothetical protein MHW47_15900, partial [Streptomyces sp. OfavH-34-F]|nr:hypothetical protein [Streptomyces sp. OfavH-34-F]